MFASIIGDSFRVTLVILFWLFTPKFRDVVGTYKFIFLLKSRCTLNCVGQSGGTDTQTLPAGKKFWPLRWWGRKNFEIFPSVIPSTSANPYDPPGETFTT